MNMSRCAALLFAAALVSAPAFAQTTTSGTAPGATTTAPSVGSASPGSAPGTAAGMDSGATAGSGTAENNPVLTASGDVRISEVIGSSVYNEKNDKLGSVSDILLDKSGKATQAVISVGGVLGVGAKLVAVPYDKLTFSDKVDSKTARVMMSGTDENALNGMPTFHFASK